MRNARGGQGRAHLPDGVGERHQDHPVPFGCRFIRGLEQGRTVDPLHEDGRDFRPGERDATGDRLDSLRKVRTKISWNRTREHVVMTRPVHRLAPVDRHAKRAIPASSMMQTGHQRVIAGDHGRAIARGGREAKPHPNQLWNALANERIGQV